MIDQMDDGLRAAIKALDEAVAPAVDAANPLAVEQLRLVTRYLGFVRERLAWCDQRDRFELRHQLALAREVAELSPGDGPAPLAMREAIESANAVARLTGATQAELRTAIDALTAAMAMLVRSLADLEPALRTPIERAIVKASGSLLDAHRAWFLPMGFEPDPEQVPPLAQALAAQR